MTYGEYETIKHDSPYAYQLSKNSQHLFYFGANHSCDPNNKQYPLLESFWTEFLKKTKGKNCIVLVEGSKRPVKNTKEEAITVAGAEGGFITFLAHQNNICTECPEPDKQHLFDHESLNQFSNDAIEYMDFAHCVQQFNRYKRVNLGLKFENYYQEYNQFNDLERMKKVHQDLFNTQFNPYDEKFIYEITNPVIQKTVINKLCRQVSIIRDNYIIEYINNLLREGKNIFIVYGCTHAVMQEPAIRRKW